MLFDTYCDKIIDILNEIRKTQSEKIISAAKMVAETLKK
ncbi:MAG: sugar isomerase, partial [Ruminococcaceae bacterium]|nr:sugar isomerase [Oscillospiraceae bacterium]